MARPRSDEKRSAILTAATRVIASQGLGAATATIAQEAGVSNGSLFTYFDTKADLFNQLYLKLKADMAASAMAGFPAQSDVREQLFHVWSNWTEWAVSHPERRRAVAQLAVSEEITAATRDAGHETMADLVDLMERARAGGAMRNVPMAFVTAIIMALMEATTDFMIRDTAHARKHCRVGFEAAWRVLT